MRYSIIALAAAGLIAGTAVAQTPPAGHSAKGACDDGSKAGAGAHRSHCQVPRLLQTGRREGFAWQAAKELHVEL